MNNGTIAVSNQVSFGRADDRGFSVYRDPPTARERRTGNGARPDDPPPDGQQTPDDDKRRKQADVLIELAEPAKLFHTADATGWNFARDLTRAQLLDRIKRGRGPRVIKLGHETWRFTRGDVIDRLGGRTFEPGARRRA